MYKYIQLIGEDVWLRDDFTLYDCAVLAEIISLDNKNGCTASNAYIAKYCKCSERTVSRSIKLLKDNGIISVHEENGISRTIRCTLAIPSVGVDSQSMGVDRESKGVDSQSMGGRLTGEGTVDSQSTNQLEKKRIEYHSNNPPPPITLPQTQNDSTVIKPMISNDEAEKIRTLYNEHRENMPPCEFMTKTTKQNIASLIAEYGNEVVETIIRIAERNDFLQGNKGKFRAHLSWLVTPSNAEKILNGNYAKDQQPPKSKEDEDWDALWRKIGGEE